MSCKFFLTLLFLSAEALAQVPTITSFVNFDTHDANVGPGSELIIFGTFASPSAGRDYTITAGGQTGGINIAANSLFILATIPPSAQPGPSTLIITYQGTPTNGLPINIKALDPAIGNYSVGFQGQSPPSFTPFRAFQDAMQGTYVTPNSPASRNEVVKVSINGIGMAVSPSVAPTVTVAGINASIVRVDANPGNETIYFGVPASAPLGIDPVVVMVSGVASNTEDLPVGTTPAIGGILNGASFGSAGVAAPGAIVSIFGAEFGPSDNLASFPASNVNGTSVQFGTTAAPIFALAATSGQINALVPMEAASGPMNVTVTDANGTSSAFNLTIAPAAPGMFYITDLLLLSRHNAIAVAANTAWLSIPLSMAKSLKIPTACNNPAQICAQPAHPGDVLQLYVTGLGLATPNGDPNGTPLATGSLAPLSGNPLYMTLLTPTVTIGGQPATVLFSGIAPGFSGLYQLDVQVPANAPPSDDVPIQISSAGITDSATIALAAAQ